MTEERTSDVASEDEDVPQKMLTLKQLLRIVPLGRASLLEMEAKGRFPRGRMLAGNRKAWLESEIAAWQRDLPKSTSQGRKRIGRA